MLCGRVRPPPHGPASALVEGQHGQEVAGEGPLSPAPGAAWGESRAQGCCLLLTQLQSRRGRERCVRNRGHPGRESGNREEGKATVTLGGPLGRWRAN